MTKSSRCCSTIWVSAILLTFCLNCNCPAQTDFFWSDRNLGEGAVNAPLFLQNVSFGETVTLYLYYSTNGPLDSDLNGGAFLDVSLSQPDNAEFLCAEALDFDILVGGVPIANRYLDSNGKGGGLGVVDLSASFIDEWFAFTETQFGIIEANNGSGVFLDSGYDAAADAFLWGAIELVFYHRVDVIIEPGDGGVVNGGEMIFPSFGIAELGVCALTPGDFNGSGTVDLGDVAPFVDALLDDDYSTIADMNCDGAVDLSDVDRFISKLEDGG